METNLGQIGQSANIPAGIFSGTEIFAHRGELYAIYNGVRILFQDLPSMEKRNFVEMYMKDKEGQEFIRKQFGITCVEWPPDAAPGKVQSGEFFHKVPAVASWPGHPPEKIAGA